MDVRTGLRNFSPFYRTVRAAAAAQKPLKNVKKTLFQDKSQTSMYIGILKHREEFFSGRVGLTAP